MRWINKHCTFTFEAYYSNGHCIIATQQVFLPCPLFVLHVQFLVGNRLLCVWTHFGRENLCWKLGQKVWGLSLQTPRLGREFFCLENNRCWGCLVPTGWRHGTHIVIFQGSFRRTFHWVPHLGERRSCVAGLFPWFGNMWLSWAFLNLLKMTKYLPHPKNNIHVICLIPG